NGPVRYDGARNDDRKIFVVAVEDGGFQLCATYPDQRLRTVLSELALNHPGISGVDADIELRPLAEAALDNRPVAEVVLLFKAVVRDAKLGAVKRAADLKLSANDKLADRNGLAGARERHLNRPEGSSGNVRDDEVLDKLDR